LIDRVNFILSKLYGREAATPWQLLNELHSSTEMMLVSGCLGIGKLQQKENSQTKFSTPKYAVILSLYLIQLKKYLEFNP